MYEFYIYIILRQFIRYIIIIILSNRIDSLSDWWDSSLRSTFDLHSWNYYFVHVFISSWIVLLARDLFLTFSWNVQHCRGLSNLLWHEILDDLPDTWEMPHRNRVAFVPWPSKVTLTCCSETPTGDVKEHSYTEFLEVCRVDDDQAILSKEADLDHRSELWANEARVVCWSWYVSTSVLTRWFSSLRSGWIGDVRVIIAVTQGCCYSIRCCNWRSCVRSVVPIFAWENSESRTDDADVLSRSTMDTFHGRRYETNHEPR